jgi:hypothetical protein
MSGSTLPPRIWERVQTSGLDLAEVEFASLAAPSEFDQYQHTFGVELAVLLRGNVETLERPKPVTCSLR